MEGDKQVTKLAFHHPDSYTFLSKCTALNPQSLIFHHEHWLLVSTVTALHKAGVKKPDAILSNYQPMYINKVGIASFKNHCFHTNYCHGH